MKLALTLILATLSLTISGQTVKEIEFIKNQERYEAICKKMN